MARQPIMLLFHPSHHKPANTSKLPYSLIPTGMAQLSHACKIKSPDEINGTRYDQDAVWRLELHYMQDMAFLPKRSLISMRQLLLNHQLPTF